ARMLLSPANHAISRRRNNYQAQQAIKNLSAAPGNAISELVGEEHRRIAKPVVLQLPSSLLLIFCQLFSSCKNAQSRAFILVYDRRNSEFNDRSERCQGRCRDHNANRPGRHLTNGVNVKKAKMSWREQNKVGRCP